MMLFYSVTKQIKYLLDPPPPQKKRRRVTNGRDVAQSACVCYIRSFTKSRLSDLAQSNHFIKNYYLIIIAFSGPHFSIYDIFIQKKAHLISTQGPLTLSLYKHYNEDLMCCVFVVFTEANPEADFDVAKLVSLPPSQLTIGSGDNQALQIACGLQHTGIGLGGGRILLFLIIYE